MPSLVSILQTALSPSPDQRFQSAEQFRDSLLQWLSGASASADARAMDADPAGSQTSGQEPTGGGPLPAAVMKFIEERLASYVGPMAGHFVRRACRTDADVASITMELADHIPDRVERDKFISAIEKSNLVSAARQRTRPDIRSRSSQPTIEAPASGAPVRTLGAEQLGRIATELAYFVGPLASRLVHSAAARAATLADLHQQLAAHIPSEEDRRKFLERARTIAPSG